MSTTDIPLRLLDTVRIASPCPMKWEDMEGNDRVRHCGQCDLNVYNFSSMTENEAEAIVKARGDGRLCAGFYRRADGTILTRDCPVGLRAIRQRTARLILRTTAVIAFILTGGLLVRQSNGQTSGLRHTQPFERLCSWLRPVVPLARSPGPQRATMTLGVCMPTPRPISSQPAPAQAQTAR